MRFFLSLCCFFAASFCVEGAKRQVTLTYATKSDPISLDPAVIYEMQTHNFLGNIYEALVGRDEKLNIVPALAEYWENRTPHFWVFHLRRNAKFHNGNRLHADDVVFSFMRSTSGDSDLKAALRSIESIEKIDDFTVGIKTKKPTPTLLNELVALKIMSQQWCEKHKCEKVIKSGKKRSSYADLHACGTGPYEVVLRQPDLKNVLKRHIYWWGDFKGNVQRVIHKPIMSNTTRVSGLISGDFDFIEPVPLQDIEKLKKNQDIEVLSQQGLTTMYVLFQTAKPSLNSSNVKAKNPFQDLRVRQAINHALDVKKICKKVLKGYCSAAGTLIAPDVKGYNRALDRPAIFDLELAKKLMQEAGYPHGFKVTFDAPLDRFVKDKEVAQAFVAMLAKINIELKLNVMPKAKFFQKVMSGKSDFFLSAWMPATQDAYEPYEGLMMTPQGGLKGAYNFGGYSNKAADEMLAKIHLEMNPEKRQVFINEVMEIHHKDLPQIPLYQEPLVLAKHFKIKLTQRKDGFIAYHNINKKK